MKAILLIGMCTLVVLLQQTQATIAQYAEMELAEMEQAEMEQADMEEFETEQFEMEQAEMEQAEMELVRTSERKYIAIVSV